jgi:hypothetical protein
VSADYSGVDNWDRMAQQAEQASQAFRRMQSSPGWRQFAREEIPQAAREPERPPVDPAWWNQAALLLIMQERVKPYMRSMVLVTEKVRGRGKQHTACPELSGAVWRCLEAGWARQVSGVDTHVVLTSPGIELLARKMQEQGRLLVLKDLVSRVLAAA